MKSAPADALEGLRRLGIRATRRSDTRTVHRRGGAHRRLPNARRRWPRRTLIVANLSSALLIVCAAAAFGYVQWRFGQVTRVSITGLHRTGHSSQSQSTGATVAPFTLLVVGSDTRNLGSGGSASFGDQSQVQGQRSDSIILVRVVPATRSLALLSIPRDTLVEVPGYGRTRINVAFNSGTPSLLVQVLDSDFGIEVNHVVEFNFDTFRAVADAVGGVEQYFPTRARDLFSDLVIPAPGCYNLVGDQALAFVRSREYQYYLGGEWHYQLYPESDLARIQRQQAFVRGLAKKAKQVAPTDLFELNSLIGSITSHLTLDSTFSNSLLLDLARDYRSANLSAIPSYTYPTANSTAVYGALDPEQAQGQSVIAQWLGVGQAAPTAPAQPATTTTTRDMSSTAPTTPVAAGGNTTNPALSGSAVVDPASSSLFHGVYIPAGLQPGQVPQTCGE